MAHLARTEGHKNAGSASSRGRWDDNDIHAIQDYRQLQDAPLTAARGNGEGIPLTPRLIGQILGES
jgi:hypothetical protein